MKRLSGFLLAALVTGGAVKLSYAQNGDNSGRFSTPAYSGTDYAQAGSGASGAGSGAAAPASGAPRTAIAPGSSSTAIQPQPGSGTALSPGAPAITPGTPAINPGVNTAITPPGTNNPAAGAATNGIVPQGTGTIGQQGNTAIGQQGTTGIGQQGIANPGAPGRPTPNGFIVNPDGSLTAVGGTAGTALGGTNTGAAAGGFVATNPPVLRTNTLPRSP
jgi:hypothetical protein